ncbi:hypothetical protein [Microbacterium sp. NPDC055455]
MDGRTGLVIGGLTAVAASVAVVTAVALTNTAALQDSPGATVTAGRILVPAAASPTTATPQAPRPTPDTAPTAAPDATAPSRAEIVEAPAPVVVDRADADPAATVSIPDAAVPAPADDLESVVAAGKTSGSWDAVRAWATAQGWSAGRIDALVARLEREQTAEKGQGPDAPAPGDSGSDQQQLVGSEAERRMAPAPQPSSATHDVGEAENPSHAQRPAHAGSNVGHGGDADPDAKKGQSRNPPDKRD